MAANKSQHFEHDEIKLAQYAKALAHPARIAILKMLVEKDVCICGEIVAIIPLAQSTVSQHLKALRKAGLVQGEIDGPKSCYCINPKAVAEFSKFLKKLMNRLEDCCP
jgi:DNA-binding transcriptional ArsR family regulator